MTVITKVQKFGSVIQLLVDEPREIHHLRSWVRELRRPTPMSRLPWLPFVVIEELDRSLTPASRVFEYGGGGSTMWFSERIGEVVTVEHDREWFDVLVRSVGTHPSCTLIYHSANDDYQAYVDSIKQFPDEHFDIVLVDGRERVRCHQAAMAKVRPGGLLVLDNSDRERYSPTFAAAAAWPHRTLSGLAPFAAIPGTTTIWQRPS